MVPGRAKTPLPMMPFSTSAARLQRPMDRTRRGVSGVVIGFVYNTPHPLSPATPAYIWRMLYLGPETAMPLASALAAIAGVAVMFWHKTVAIFRGIGRGIARLLGRR